MVRIAKPQKKPRRKHIGYSAGTGGLPPVHSISMTQRAKYVEAHTMAVSFRLCILSETNVIITVPAIYPAIVSNTKLAAESRGIEYTCIKYGTPQAP